MRVRPLLCLAGVAGLILTAASVQAKQVSPGAWRTSELAGVPILDPSRISIGKVDDMLMSPDGRMQYVVIGTGGLFGVGAREVAVPFSAVHFSSRPIEAPPNPVTTSSTGAPAGSLGAASAGGFADPAAVLDGPAAQRPPRTVGHPDHGTIDMTADQLKQAPAFRFSN